MERIAQHTRLFEYDRWANQEVVRALRAAESVAPQALTTLGHVVGAERLWLARVQHDAGRVVVWPELSLDGCASAIDATALGWRDFLGKLTPAALELPVAYTNSQGERWSNRVDDILTHVVLHSAYHRGQIASELRRSGAEPVYTDFIHAVRQGCVE